jgi:hypothetical protein
MMMILGMTGMVDRWDWQAQLEGWLLAEEAPAVYAAVGHSYGDRLQGLMSQS